MYIYIIYTCHMSCCFVLPQVANVRSEELFGAKLTYIYIKIIYTYTHIYIHTYIHIYVYIYICIYIYIHTIFPVFCTYIYIYVYIYIHTIFPVFSFFFRLSLCGAKNFFGAKLTYVYILKEYVHKHIYTYIHTCICIIIIYIHTIFPVFSSSSGCECAERRTVLGQN